MHQPEPQQKESSPYSKWERRGSAIAHASGLLVGMPFFIFLLRQPEIAFLLNPVVSYLIARSFRRRRLAWGAFQGMQASVAHLIIVVLLFIVSVTPGSSPTLGTLLTVLFAAAILLFLYTLWAAWDTLLGYDFRYIIIGKFLDRVSQANLQRQERRRGLIPSRHNEQDDRPRS